MLTYGQVSPDVTVPSDLTNQPLLDEHANREVRLERLTVRVHSGTNRMPTLCRRVPDTGGGRSPPRSFRKP